MTGRSEAVWALAFFLVFCWLLPMVVVGWEGVEPPPMPHNPNVRRVGYFPDPLPSDPERLIVHIVAHTHDDVGWLKTVDEYYLGANNSIQDAGVQYIIDSVVLALQANPERKFIYVEIAFFERWWHEQTDATKSIVRDLVSTGRLEFINGGWVMNDEACTQYEAIIDQMTEGHNFLFKEFGIRPTIGWHIDPFGHASTQASLFAQMGFNAFFFSRIDYQDKILRNATKELELVWRGSKSLGKKTEIFTSITYEHYVYPTGFAFEQGSPPINNDPRIFNLNVKERSDVLAQYLRKMSASYRTPNLLITFGSDFQFENANVNFKNMDKLIQYIRTHPEYNIDIFYSTPSIYTDYVHKYSEEHKMKWQLKTDDFFPYADNPWSYWTGYFTSRAALKGYIRSRSNLLHGTERLFVTSRGVLTQSINTLENLAKIDRLSQACAVGQHHDAVTGTEKQHVAYDYAERLSIGSAWCESLIADVIGKLLTKKSDQNYINENKKRLDLAPPQFEFCQYLNESRCEPLNSVSAHPVPVVAYNPLAWDRTYWFRLPVPIANVEVIGDKGVLPIQVMENLDVPKTFIVYFSAPIRALSVASFIVQRKASASDDKKTVAPIKTYTPSNAAEISISNDHLRLVFYSDTGRLGFVENKDIGVTISATQQLVWYNASAGNNKNSSQASGAYIFRPNRTETFNFTQNNVANISVVRGDLVSEVRQYWLPWAYQTIRLFKNEKYIESEYTIGPVSIADRFGKEIVTRWNTSLSTNSTWYTDSEGQEMEWRKLDFRPTYKLNNTEPVSDNYYPINTAIYIEDTRNNMRFTVVADRSHGGSSLDDGELEVMLQRRLLYDDDRGVGEALNESDIIRVTQHVIIDRIDTSSRQQRTQELLLNNPVIPMFVTNWQGTAKDWFTTYPYQFNPLTQSLPPNVHLETLRALDTTDQVLLRLNHIYAIGEDSVYSKPVTIDLNTLFVDMSIISITEMTLSGNMPLSEVKRYTWDTYSSDSPNQHRPTSSASSPVDAAPTSITLNPMEIRTFIVRLSDGAR